MYGYVYGYRLARACVSARAADLSGPEGHAHAVPRAAGGSLLPQRHVSLRCVHPPAVVRSRPVFLHHQTVSFRFRVFLFFYWQTERLTIRSERLHACEAHNTWFLWEWSLRFFFKHGVTSLTHTIDHVTLCRPGIAHPGSSPTPWSSPTPCPLIAAPKLMSSLDRDFLVERFWFPTRRTRQSGEARWLGSIFQCKFVASETKTTLFTLETSKGRLATICRCKCVCPRAALVLYFVAAHHRRLICTVLSGLVRTCYFPLVPGTLYPLFDSGDWAPSHVSVSTRVPPDPHTASPRSSLCTLPPPDLRRRRYVHT